MNQQTMIVVAVVVVLLALAAVAWMMSRKRQKVRLRERFGPEYEHAVHQHGDPARAEAELANRERRVAKMRIRTLNQDEAERFAADWRATQARFVDDPRDAVTQADRLVGDLMQARGYPVGEFEQRAADLSVDHPTVVSNYRAAHEIALRHARGEASTEDLRQAFVHYRALFEELLDTRDETTLRERRTA